MTHSTGKVAPFPMMALIATGTPTGVYTGVVIAFVGHALYYATLSGYLSPLFPTELRFTGISLGYQLSGSLISAFVPAVAAWMIGPNPDNFLPAQVLYATLVALSLIAIIVGPRVSRYETRRYEESKAAGEVSAVPAPTA